MTEPTQNTGPRRPERLALLVALALAVVSLVALALPLVLWSKLAGRPAPDTAALARVADCTSVTGTCYKQRVMVDLYIAQCAKVTNTDGEMVTCVNERLQAAGVGLQLDAVEAPPATGPASPTPSTAQDEDVTP